MSRWHVAGTNPVVCTMRNLFRVTKVCPHDLSPGVFSTGEISPRPVRDLSPGVSSTGEMSPRFVASCVLTLQIRGRRPIIFRLDKTRAECFQQLQKRSVIGYFRFLIQLLIRMKFCIKSHVRLYKILCSLVVFFLTSISFIRHKVTVLVLIFFVFPSWITNAFFNLFSSFFSFSISVNERILSLFSSHRKN